MMNKLWASWVSFWFVQPDLFRVAGFRFLFSMVALIMYSVRVIEFEAFFTDRGLMTAEALNFYLPNYLRPPFFLFFSNETLSLVASLVFLVLLLFLTLGLLNRFGTLLVFVLHLGFLHRNPTIMYGADLVATFWFFYLIFIQHSHYFTIRRQVPFLKDKTPRPDVFSNIGIRLIQIQLCIIYAYTGLEKLKGITWWEGTAVWYVLENDNIVPYNLSFFQHVPGLVAIMTFSTLIFEIYFPMAIWLKPLKRVWLFLGVCLHGLSAIFMGLVFFCSRYAFILSPVPRSRQDAKLFGEIETSQVNVKIY